MAVILDPRKCCEDIEKEFKSKIAGKKICLASVAVGSDYVAQKYRASQERAAQRFGIEYRSLALPSKISFADFKSEIKKLNQDSSVTGIIINKPFPSEWNETDVFSLIDERKDIEGMHPVNLGRLVSGDILVSSVFSAPIAVFISPTVVSILKLLEMTKISIRGKRVTIVGFSSLIGKPLALILANNFATVSITHIATYEKGDLEEYVRRSDVVISAVGKPHLIKGAWIKEGAVVIDAGIGEKDGKLAGDVEFEAASNRAAFITPVSGGVGKLTTLNLYFNLAIAAVDYKL